jgi:hypothetical protein
MLRYSVFTVSAICGKNTLKMLQKSIFNREKHQRHEKIRQSDEEEQRNGEFALLRMRAN